MKRKILIIQILSIVIFLFIFFLACVNSYTEKNIVTPLSSLMENNLPPDTKTILKQIQPFSFDYTINKSADIIIAIWFFGLLGLFIFRYFGLLQPKEKNINKTQKIILSIAIPIILIVFSIMIANNFYITGSGFLFILLVTLILITIYEFDLFGNRKIFNSFDLKFLLKNIIFFFIVFFGIFFLGLLFPVINIGKELIIP
ncbi:MAG: hypothetical protein PHW83_06255 [Bacteroidales bacterium]|nr:hypothetical protein [Bacteroidales bacterium]